MMPSKQILRIAYPAGYMFLRRSGVSGKMAHSMCAEIIAETGERTSEDNANEIFNGLRDSVLAELKMRQQEQASTLPKDPTLHLIEEAGINPDSLERAWGRATGEPGTAEDLFHKTWLAGLIEECTQNVRSTYKDTNRSDWFDALWGVVGVRSGPAMRAATDEAAAKFGVDSEVVKKEAEALRKQFGRRLRALAGATLKSGTQNDITKELIELCRTIPFGFYSETQSTRIIPVEELLMSSSDRALSETDAIGISTNSSSCDDPIGLPVLAELLSLGLNSNVKAERVSGWTPPEPPELQRRFDRQGLNRFAVKELLGHGGMGAVYRVTNQNTRQDYAVKILRSDLAELDDRFIDDFTAEAAMLASIHHPGIVKAFDCAYLEPMPESAASTEEDGRRYVFIVMDLLRGHPLASDIKNGPMEPAIALRLFSQLCEAMQAAHSLSIVHRDLKPDNIFICHDGTAKVLDFGIARWTRPGPAGSQYVLQTGRILGTVGYMAPEQKDGGMIDQRTDVFTLGIILYEMLTGHRPEGSFEPASKVSAADPLVDAVIACCLHRDRLLRYSSAGELGAAIHAILEAPRKAEELKIHLALSLAQNKIKLKLRRRLIGAGVALTLAFLSLFIAWLKMREEQRTRDSAEMLVERILGDVRDQLEAAGRLDLLATVSEAARDYYAHAPPGASKTKSLRNQAWALKYHADVMRGLGKRQEADDEYLAHVSLLKTLHQGRPDDLQISREYAQALGQAGRVWEGKNDFESAGTVYDEQLEMLKKMAQSHPDDSDIGMAVASAWENLGYLNSAMARTEDAEFAFRQQLTQCEKWYTRTEKLDPDLQRNLAKSHGNLGDVLLKVGKPDGALKHYSNQKEMLDDLSANNPGDSRITHDLAVAWNKLGKTLLMSKEYDKAKIAFDQFHAKALYLHEKVDPQQPGYKRMLATSLSNLGDVLMRLADYPQAEESYNQDLNIMRILVADFPDDSALLADLGLSWCNLFNARNSRNATEDAAAAMSEARRIVQKLEETKAPDAVQSPLKAAIHLAETPGSVESRSR